MSKYDELETDIMQMDLARAEDTSGRESISGGGDADPDF